MLLFILRAQGTAMDCARSFSSLHCSSSSFYSSSLRPITIPTRIRRCRQSKLIYATSSLPPASRPPQNQDPSTRLVSLLSSWHHVLCTYWNNDKIHIYIYLKRLQRRGGREKRTCTTKVRYFLPTSLSLPLLGSIPPHLSLSGWKLLFRPTFSSGLLVLHQLWIGLLCRQ